jgi:hypothetical protein
MSFSTIAVLAARNSVIAESRRVNVQPKVQILREQLSATAQCPAFNSGRTFLTSLAPFAVVEIDGAVRLSVFLNAVKAT